MEATARPLSGSDFVGSARAFNPVSSPPYRKFTNCNATENSSAFIAWITA